MKYQKDYVFQKGQFLFEYISSGCTFFAWLLITAASAQATGYKAAREFKQPITFFKRQVSAEFSKQTDCWVTNGRPGDIVINLL